MSNDFRVPTDIASRRSTRRLIAIAGIQGFASWTFAQARIAAESPDGDTSTWTLDEWAELSAWPGDPLVFLAALTEARLVVASGDGWVPVGWAEEQPHLLNARERSASARRAAQARWNRYLQPALPLAIGILSGTNLPDTERTPERIGNPESRLAVAGNRMPGTLQYGTTPNQVLRTAGGTELALPPAGAPPFRGESWPDAVRVVADRLGEVFRGPIDQRLQADVRQFDEPEYWTAIDAWLGADDSRVFYLDEWRKFWAWHVARPLSQRRRALKQTFRNWLAKTERWKEFDAQREEIRRSETPRRRR